MLSYLLAGLLTIIIPAQPTCAGLRNIGKLIADNAEVTVLYTTNEGELWKLELDWQRDVFGKQDLADNIYSLCVVKEMHKPRTKEWM